jgi:hypothetical protein
MASQVTLEKNQKYINEVLSTRLKLCLLTPELLNALVDKTDLGIEREESISILIKKTDDLLNVFLHRNVSADLRQNLT